MLGDYLEEKDKFYLFGKKYLYNFAYNILFPILGGHASQFYYYFMYIPFSYSSICSFIFNFCVIFFFW